MERRSKERLRCGWRLQQVMLRLCAFLYGAELLSIARLKPIRRHWEPPALTVTLKSSNISLNTALVGSVFKLKNQFRTWIHFVFSSFRFGSSQSTRTHLPDDRLLQRSLEDRTLPHRTRGWRESKERQGKHGIAWLRRVWFARDTSAFAVQWRKDGRRLLRYDAAAGSRCLGSHAHRWPRRQQLRDGYSQR